MSTVYPASYSTVEDIYQTLPQVGSVSNVTSRNIVYQIGRVEATMNAKLSKAFTLPFSQQVLQLTSISTDLTICALTKRFTVLSKLKGSKDFSLYKQANKMLDDIVDGKVPLLDASNEKIASGSSAGFEPWSNNKSYAPTFNEQPFSEGEVDEDKAD